MDGVIVRFRIEGIALHGMSKMLLTNAAQRSASAAGIAAVCSSDLNPTERTALPFLISLATAGTLSIQKKMFPFSMHFRNAH